jgi:hypothetical protein
VITFAPPARVVVENAPVAWAKRVLEFTPPTTGTGAPRGVPLSKNCNDPFGSCDALAVALLCVATVAVMVTLVLGGTVV